MKVLRSLLTSLALLSMPMNSLFALPSEQSYDSEFSEETNPDSLSLFDIESLSFNDSFLAFEKLTEAFSTVFEKAGQKLKEEKQRLETHFNKEKDKWQKNPDAYKESVKKNLQDAKEKVEDTINKLKEKAKPEADKFLTLLQQNLEDLQEEAQSLDLEEKFRSIKLKLGIDALIEKAQNSQEEALETEDEL